MTAIILIKPTILSKDFLVLIWGWIKCGDPIITTFLNHIADISLSITIAYILVIIVFYSSSFIKIFVYSLLLLIFQFSTFISYVFGRDINALTIQQICETSTSETIEFLTTYLCQIRGLFAVFLTLTILLIIVILEKHKNSILNRIKYPFKKILLTTTVILLLFSCIYTFTNIICGKYFKNGQFRTYNCNTILKLSYSVSDYKKELDKINVVSMYSTLLSKSNCTFCENNDSINIVYILGESFNKKHASIYDYYLPTTPNLVKEKENGNLYVFTDVISPFPATTNVVKNTFFLNDLAEGEKHESTPFFPQLFKQSGYCVDMIDCQSANGFFNDLSTGENVLLYNKTISINSYSNIFPIKYSYDLENIQNYYETIKMDSVAKRLTIIHLMGQHLFVSNRFPHTRDNDYFSLADINNNLPFLTNKKKQTIVDYDNATRYNDKTIEYIIEQYRDKNAVVLYFSDHGEEIYDYRDNYGRRSYDSKNFQEWVHCLFDIPFIIWCSDKYKEKHPETIKMIENALNKPFSTDIVGHILLHLASIQTDYYKSYADPLNIDFKKRNRFIYTDNNERLIYEIVSKQNK